MAIRMIRTEEDEILRKRSKEVAEINHKIITLLEDMAETMYKEHGVGLAAPQVGMLKRVIVLDDGNGLLKLVNPKIINIKSEQIVTEGCLSVPGIFGKLKRPDEVTVEALNEKGEKVEIIGKGFLASILCHEIDHLDGILFKDKVIEYID